MKPLVVALAQLLLLGSTLAAQSSVTVADTPPVVVKTVPQSGELAVDPALQEITVTFSKDMLTHESWSWAQITPESFPKLAGKAHYMSDKRTCVLPVRFERGKTYAIWVNSERFKNFRDVANRPAVPYLLVFQTKP